MGYRQKLREWAGKPPLSPRAELKGRTPEPRKAYEPPAVEETVKSPAITQAVVENLGFLKPKKRKAAKRKATKAKK